MTNNNTDYIATAINNLAVAQDANLHYSYSGFITNETGFNAINVEDGKTFSFSWTDVQAKATELENADAQKVTDKANAKEKLIAGEALTQAEADTIVI